MTGTIIETKYGKIEGIRKDGCVQFLGVPFAKAPVGELAFRHPVEPDCWTETLQCFKGCKNPVQHVGLTGSPNMSQDCLYLNVFMPESDRSDLPVMVWFFGGSYAEGGSGAIEEDGQELIYNFSKLAVEQNVIVVSFNYRLNLYGFLNLSFLSSRFDDNCGLMDQILALKFVRENIGKFGGNKNNVTLFGQSAGAACILALMSIPEADGLFSKAALMSPCVEHFYSQEESRRNTLKYLKILGVKPDETDRLLNLSIKEVDEANKKFSRYMRFSKMELRCAFSPAIDGVILKDEPKKLAVNCTKPLLLSTAAEEANPFILPIPVWMVWFMAKILHVKVKKNPGRSYKHRVSDEISKIIYFNPADEIERNYKGDFTRFHYSYVTPANRLNGLGCYHFSDVPVLTGFSVLTQDVSDEESQAEGVKMRKMYADFARK